MSFPDHIHPSRNVTGSPLAPVCAREMAQRLCRRSSYDSPCRHARRSIGVEDMAKCAYGERVESYLWAARESSRPSEPSCARRGFTTSHPPHFALCSARALVAYLELSLWGRPSNRHHNPVRALRETFPAPHPRPELPNNVTIESMKVHPSGTMILASGIVHAHLI
ncbi:hypothetical protein EDB86DRAFT_2057960 [Lactarius hatsudake]|nr:hypothetical protein EDB86DRAFT_2057960 [Lactarius hatsudake]